MESNELIFDLEEAAKPENLCQLISNIVYAVSKRFLPIPIILDEEQEDKQVVVLYKHAQHQVNGLYWIPIKYEEQIFSYLIHYDSVREDQNIPCPALITELALQDEHGRLHTRFLRDISPLTELATHGLPIACNYPDIARVNLMIPTGWSKYCLCGKMPEFDGEELQPPKVINSEFDYFDFREDCPT